MITARLVCSRGWRKPQPLPQPWGSFRRTALKRSSRARGAGHAFAGPTVRFHGTPEAGWRAVADCIAYGLPIDSLRPVWDVLDTNEPTGPHWKITFRERMR